MAKTDKYFETEMQKHRFERLKKFHHAAVDARRVLEIQQQLESTEQAFARITSIDIEVLQEVEDRKAAIESNVLERENAIVEIYDNLYGDDDLARYEL